MPIAPSAWPSSYTSLATSWVSGACRLDGLIDAPGELSGVAETGREHMVPGATGAKEGARVGHARAPVVDRDGAFQPLS
eukprot:3396351-Prymnesium_polylepis.1